MILPDKFFEVQQGALDLLEDLLKTKYVCSKCSKVPRHPLACSSCEGL
jgi:hypothetical protein